MHIYNAMSKARDLWGDDAIVKQSIIVQNDGRLNLQFDVGYYLPSGGSQFFGGGSFEEAFKNAHAGDDTAIGTSGDREPDWTNRNTSDGTIVWTNTDKEITQ
jgi:hypothetical protein